MKTNRTPSAADLLAAAPVLPVEPAGTVWGRVVIDVTAATPQALIEALRDIVTGFEAIGVDGMDEASDDDDTSSWYVSEHGFDDFVVMRGWGHVDGE